MGEWWARGAGNPGLDEETPSTVYDVTLTFSVPNPALLWRAAARHLERSGLEPDLVDETIGAIEDPSIDDCLATLMMPAVAEGCDLVDFHIVPAERTGFDPGSCAGLRTDH